MKKTFFILMFCIWSLVGFAECMPLFPYADHWLGGDGAYSIDLNNGQRLWFFGDTFIEQEGNTNRKNATMISNSIGVSVCRNDVFSIKYFWQDENPPKDFFVSKDPSIIYWPRAGFYYGGEVYVFLSKIHKEPKKGMWGFENKGTMLAIISSIHLAPRDWKIRYVDLPLGPKIWGAAAVVLNGLDGKYAYIFSAVGNENHPVILLRMPLPQLKLETPTVSIEMLTETGDWQSKIKLKKAKIVIPSAATEMSVHFDKKEWVAIYSSSFISKSPGVVYRSAPQMDGPWSEEKEIYSYKEPIKDRDVFCYAAKAHAGMGKDDSSWVITYVCNHFSFNRLIDDLTTYRPISILYQHLIKRKHV